jgi:Fic family protein
MKHDTLTAKKQTLDKYKPLPEALLRNLDEWFRVELTYTSNAIEGNTLTRRETAVVIEDGLTVSGKSLKEHMEAVNHARALDHVRKLASKKISNITEKAILDIHAHILKGIDDNNAGCYRSIPVRISGSAAIMPNARKVPDLMAGLVRWLTTRQSIHPVQFAGEAHYRLVTIHPFSDGNGRTARLLMNLILMMHGYPPAIIRKRDRLVYLNALEEAQLGNSKSAYENLIFKAVDHSLDIYLQAVQGEPAPFEEDEDHKAFLKIGGLARAVGETVPTIRYWTKEGLLDVNKTTDSGYYLYAPAMIERCKQIQKLKLQRYMLREIKHKLNAE